MPAIPLDACMDLGSGGLEQTARNLGGLGACPFLDPDCPGVERCGHSLCRRLAALAPGDVLDEWREGETVRAVMVGVDRWRARLLTSPLPTPGEVAGFVRAVARYPGPGTLPEGARDDLCASIAQVVRGGGSCEWGGVRWGRG